MLSEKSESQRDRLYSPTYMTFWKRQNYGDREQFSVARGGGRFNYKEASSTREFERCWVILYSVYRHVLKLVDLHAPEKRTSLLVIFFIIKE